MMSSSGIYINIKVSKILARNLNTVHIPNERSGIRRSCCKRSLLSSTNRFSIDHKRRSSSRLVNRNNNTLDFFASINIVVRSRNRIGSRCCRSNRNRRVRTQTITPIIGNIACPTISVSIQHNRLTLANRQIGSRDLKVGTKGGNSERIRGGGAGSIGNLNSVNTGTHIRQLMRSGSSAANPFIRIRSIIRNSQCGGLAFANHIVTRDDHTLRSGIHSNRSRSSENSRLATLGAHTLNRIGMRASGSRANRDGRSLTGNHLIVFIPYIICSITRSGDGCCFTLADSSGICGNSRNARGGKTHNHDAGRFLTRTALGFYRIGIVTSGRNHYINSGVGTCCTCGPLIRDVTRPTISVGIEGNMLIQANSRGTCGNLQVSTEFRNGERGRHGFATIGALCNHIVSTRSSIQCVGRAESTTVPSILSSTRCRSCQCGGGTGADNIGTGNHNIGRSGFHFHSGCAHRILARIVGVRSNNPEGVRAHACKIN